MKGKTYEISDIQAISADVWKVFKKYFPADADTDSFADDVHALDEKYKDKPGMYEFMQKLLKVYFQELNTMKGLKNAKDGKSNT